MEVDSKEGEADDERSLCLIDICVMCIDTFTTINDNLISTRYQIIYTHIFIDLL